MRLETVQLVIAHLVTTQVRIGSVHISCTLEIIGTALGYGADSTTCKSAQTNIVRRRRYRNLIQSIERDWRSVAREVTTNTEGVVERSTIHSNVRLTVITTTYRETATYVGTLRSQLQEVVHATRYGRNSLNLVGINTCCSTSTVGAHVVVAISHNHYVFQLSSILSQSLVQDCVLTKRKRNALYLLVLVTHVGYFQNIRSTRAHTLNRITTIHVGHCTIDCTRRLVNSLDCCANDIFAISCNFTTNARCCYLRHCCGYHKGQQSH